MRKLLPSFIIAAFLFSIVTLPVLAQTEEAMLAQKFHRPLSAKMKHNKVDKQIRKELKKNLTVEEKAAWKAYRDVVQHAHEQYKKSIQEARTIFNDALDKAQDNNSQSEEGAARDAWKQARQAARQTLRDAQKTARQNLQETLLALKK